MRTNFALLILGASLVGCAEDPTQTAAAPSGAAAPTQTAPTPASKSTASTELAAGTPVDLPFLTWGGDAATIEANGGAQTTKGSVFDSLGLNFKLVNGNDPEVQVKAYLAGTTPYLRLTSQQIADVAPELCKSADTCPVPIDQLSWSTGGDHVVALGAFKTIADLKGGARIALQDKGPHGGLLADMIEVDAKLKFADVKIVMAKNLTGPDSPVSMLQSNPPLADAAFVISPDVGTLISSIPGAEGSVIGAHEILSTADRTRSIPDLYYVNPAYFKAHPEDVTKFVAGQNRGQELVVELQKAYNSSAGSDDYRRLLAQIMEIMGSDVPGEADAAGLIADCSFVGHPGNVAFFTDASNPTGWSYFAKRGAEVAVKLGYATKANPIGESPIDWNDPIFGKLLTKTEAAKGPRFDVVAVKHQIEQMEEDGSLATNTRLSFTAFFGENETSIDPAKYKVEFARIVELSHSYTGAPIVIRGHADPTHMIATAVKAGIAEGLIQQSGNTTDGYSYFMDGHAVNLKSDQRLLKLATDPRYNGSYPQGQSPKELASAAVQMTEARSSAVRDALIAFAKQSGSQIDATQIQVQGAGFADPLVVKASTPAEAAQNRRVEFSVVHVTAEAATQSDFAL